MGTLNKYYNRKYTTDFDAYYKMYQIIKETFKNKNLISLAKNGIITSYLRNHEMMITFHDYDSLIHQKMIKHIFTSGSIWLYLIQKTKIYIRSLVIVFAPSLLVKKKLSFLLHICFLIKVYLCL